MPSFREIAGHIKKYPVEHACWVNAINNCRKNNDIHVLRYVDATVSISPLNKIAMCACLLGMGCGDKEIYEIVYPEYITQLTISRLT